MVRKVYKLVIALSLGALCYGCSRKPPLANKSIPEVKSDQVATPTTKITADPYQLREVPASLTIYVPQGSKLERQTVKGKLYNAMPTAPSTYACVVAEKSIPLLFQKANHSFPAGTRLTEWPKIPKREDVMYVSLSKEFLQRDFWKSKQQAQLAIHAIVNTAAAGYPLPENPLSVKLLIEDKPFRNFAKIDMSKPLLPRFGTLVSRKTN